MLILLVDFMIFWFGCIYVRIFFLGFKGVLDEFKIEIIIVVMFYIEINIYL